MKKSDDIIGNRTLDLSACSAVPQPTAPPRALKKYTEKHKNLEECGPFPRLCGFYPGMCLTTEEKTRENLRQGSHT